MPILSPNMSLPVPIPSVDEGPAWAQSEVSCYSILDAHNHAPGSGVPITPSGLNINADLSFQTTSSATNVKSVGFTASTVTALSSIYVHGVDLYFNDGSGNAPIQITSGGAVVGPTGNIQGLPSTPTGGAQIAWQNAQGTFAFSADSGAAGANLDAGALILRAPVSAPTPSGTYISLRAPDPIGSSYTLTLPAAAATTPNSFLVMATDGSLSYKYIDDSTINFTGSSLQIKDLGVTTAKIAALNVTGAKIADNSISTSKLVDSNVTTAKIADSNVTTAKIATGAITQGRKQVRTQSQGLSGAAGDVVVSNPAATQTFTSTSFTTVTNMTVTLATLGNPIRVDFTGGTGPAYMSLISATTVSSAQLEILIDGVTVFTQTMSNPTINGLMVIPLSSFSTTIPFIAAGSHTITVKVAIVSGTSPSAVISNGYIIAYEI